MLKLLRFFSNVVSVSSIYWPEQMFFCLYDYMFISSLTKMTVLNRNILNKLFWKQPFYVSNSCNNYFRSRERMDGSDLQFYLTWLKDQLKAQVTNFDIPIVSCYLGHFIIFNFCLVFNLATILG